MSEPGPISEDSAFGKTRGNAPPRTSTEPNSPTSPVTPSSNIPSEPTAASEAPKPVLSEDEQMALFEAELKEKDWGHQPC